MPMRVGATGRPASASIRPASAGAWRERLGEGGILEPRVLAAFATVPRHLVRRRRARHPGLRGHQPADRPRPDDLQAFGGRPDDRAAVRRRECAPAREPRRRARDRYRMRISGSAPGGGLAAGDLGRAAEASSRQGAGVAGAAALHPAAAGVRRRHARPSAGRTLRQHHRRRRRVDAARRPGWSSWPSAAGWSRRSSRPGAGRRWWWSTGARTATTGGFTRPCASSP